jgi:DNA helicase II / ATP-dependent DNA helicase PcrA
VFVRSSSEYPRTPSTAFIEGLAAWATSPRGESGLKLAELLLRWRRLLGPSWERRLDVELVRLLMTPEAEDQGPAREFLEGVLGLGALDALRSRQETQEDADSLARMRGDLAIGGKLEGLTITNLGDRALARNRVHVLTMHSSKGLEFDVVCMLGLEANRLPRWNSSSWEIAQARRQFYVALTRARYEAHLYYAGWRRDRYGRRWDDGPSRFVTNLELA